MDYYGVKYRFSIDDFFNDLEKTAQQAGQPKVDPAKSIALQLATSLSQEMSQNTDNSKVKIYMRDVQSRSAFIEFLARNQITAQDGSMLVYKGLSDGTNPVPENDRAKYAYDKEDDAYYYQIGLAAYLAGLEDNSGGEGNELFGAAVKKLIDQFGRQGVDSARKLMSGEGAPTSVPTGQMTNTGKFDAAKNPIFTDSKGLMWIFLKDQPQGKQWRPLSANAYNGAEGASKTPNVPGGPQGGKFSEQDIMSSFPFTSPDSLSPRDMEEFTNTYYSYSLSLPENKNTTRLKSDFAKFYNARKREMASWDEFVNKIRGAATFRDSIRFTTANGYQTLVAAFGNTDANAKEAAMHLRDMVSISIQEFEAIKRYPEGYGLGQKQIDNYLSRAETHFNTLNSIATR